MAKKKVVRETATWRSSEANGKETSPDSMRSPKTGFFLHFWILFDFLMQKDQQEKLEDGLVSLTLTTCTIF